MGLPGDCVCLFVGLAVALVYPTFVVRLSCFILNGFFGSMVRNFYEGLVLMKYHSFSSISVML